MLTLTILWAVGATVTFVGLRQSFCDGRVQWGASALWPVFLPCVLIAGVLKQFEDVADAPEYDIHAAGSRVVPWSANVGFALGADGHVSRSLQNADAEYLPIGLKAANSEGPAIHSATS
jgi:hypothetical protein